MTAFTHIVRRLRSERGQALVEFALIAPLFFVLLFGMLDFGKAFNYWSTQQQMANEGARLAAVNTAGPWTCPDGTSASTLPAYVKCNAVTNELRNGGSFWLTNVARVCVRAAPNGPGTLNAGDPVQVVVTSTYKWLPLIAQRISVTQATITGAATMRLEAPLAAANTGCTS